MYVRCAFKHGSEFKGQFRIKTKDYGELPKFELPQAALDPSKDSYIDDVASMM